MGAKLVFVWRVGDVRLALGSCLWGVFLPAMTWAHHGSHSPLVSPELLWLFLPPLAFGVAFAVVWVVSILLAKQRKPRS